jgi:membrane associated rhomboid family serine protease
MLKPAPVTHFFWFPITAAVAIGAIIVTVQWWTGQTIDMMAMDGRVWENWQLWRGLTCIFPHANVFHLMFNLFWFWTFGTLLERIYGHVQFLLMIAFLAFVSSLAEFTFLSGGIGLSGVVYGLWGMLWVLQRNDPRFIGVVDDQTSKTFVFWFFLCIILTHLGMMPVANLAHAGGAVAGFLLGYVIGGKWPARLKSGLALAALTALLVAGSTVWWPYVNFSEYSEAYVENTALERLDHGDKKGAVQFLETATKMRKAGARTWYNLGIAYRDSGQLDKALAAAKHAVSLPDATDDMRGLVGELEALRIHGGQ